MNPDKSFSNPQPSRASILQKTRDTNSPMSNPERMPAVSPFDDEKSCFPPSEQVLVGPTVFPPRKNPADAHKFGTGGVIRIDCRKVDPRHHPPNIEFVRIHYALPCMWLSVGTGAEFHFKVEKEWTQNR